MNDATQQAGFQPMRVYETNRFSHF